jgi:hypothetical protein
MVAMLRVRWTGRQGGGNRGSRRVISTKGVLLPFLGKGLCYVGHPVSDLPIELLDRRVDREPFVVTPHRQLFHSNQERLTQREFQKLRGCS